MSNDYFDGDDYTALQENTTARASAVNAILNAVVAGFDKIPALLGLRQGRVTYAADTGAANAYVVALPTALASYVEGASITMKAANANTGASTLNVDGLGVKAIKRYNGDDLAAGDLVAGMIVTLTYDGANFVLSGVHGSERTAIATSAADAATSAIGAATSATTAGTHKTDAQAAQTAAESAASRAETAESNAGAIANSDIVSALVGYQITGVVAMKVCSTRDDDDPDWPLRARSQSWYAEYATQAPTGAWLGGHQSETTAVAAGGVVDDYYWDEGDQRAKKITGTSPAAAEDIYRGSKAQFPQNFIVIVRGAASGSSAVILIFDADSPEFPLWMSWNRGSSAFMGGGAFAQGKAIAYHNGMLVYGAAYAVTRFNFPADNHDIREQGGNFVLQRGNGRIYPRSPLDDPSQSLPPDDIAGDAVNGVALWSDPTTTPDPTTGLRVPVVAAATNNGISIIQEDGTVRSASNTTEAYDVAFREDGTLIAITGASQTLITAPAGWRQASWPQTRRLVTGDNAVGPYPLSGGGAHLLPNEFFASLGYRTNKGGTIETSYNTLSLRQLHLLDGYDLALYLGAGFVSGVFPAGHTIFATGATTDSTAITPLRTLVDNFSGYADQAAAVSAGYAFSSGDVTFDAAGDKVDIDAATTAYLELPVYAYDDGDVFLIEFTVSDHVAGTLTLQHPAGTNVCSASADGTCSAVIEYEEGEVIRLSTGAAELSISNVTIKQYDFADVFHYADKAAAEAAGWSTYDTPTADDMAWAISSGKLSMTRGSGDTKGAPVRTFTGLDVGQTYVLAVGFDSSVGNVISDSDHGLTTAGLGRKAGLSSGTHVFSFVAVQTTMGLTFWCNVSATLGVLDVFLERAEPDRLSNLPGFVPRSNNVSASATMSRQRFGTGTSLYGLRTGEVRGEELQVTSDDLDVSEYAIAFWARNNGIGNATILQITEAGGANSLTIDWNTAAPDGLRFATDFGGNVQIYDDGIAWDGEDSGLWSFVVCQQQGARMELWRDGFLIATGTASGSPSWTSGTALTLGDPRIGGARLSDQALVRMTDRVLTPGEIQATYNVERAWFNTNADPTLLSDRAESVAYDETTGELLVGSPSGTTILDARTFARTGTLTTDATVDLDTTDHEALAAGYGINLIADAEDVRIRRNAIALRAALRDPASAPVRLPLQRYPTADATPAVVASVPCLEGERRTLEATVRAAAFGPAASGEEGAQYRVRWTQYRPIGGNVTLFGTPTVTVDYEVTSSQALTVAADTSNQLVELTGTGVASTELLWETAIEVIA